ncbi:MAG: response regulator [Spirulinaceae cyanobacterium]
MISPDRNKPKILVVDDEQHNLDLLYRTFYRDYQVLTASDGPMALEILAREENIAVIISDQRMPKMSGTELLSLSAIQYPDVIRIILTGYTDVGDLVEAINTGKVFKYVTKPWQEEELKIVVKQALDTHNVLKVRTEGLRRMLRRESLLNSIISTIRNAEYSFPGHSPLKEVLQTIVNTLGKMLGVDVGILRPLADEHLLRDGECFIYQKDNQELSQVLCPLELVWETEQIEIINDVEKDPRLKVHQLRGIALAKADIRSTLIVPFIFQGELMAILALHQHHTPHAWEEEEIKLTEMVADQAALAISQARAYEQVRALAQREALINNITTVIRSSLEPQEIFMAITKELGQALKVDGCALSLWEEDDDFVQCVGLYDGREARAFGEYAEEDDTNHSATPSFAQLIPQSFVPITGNPLLQELLQTKKPVVSEDLKTKPSEVSPNLPFRSPARALLLVPLIVDEKIIGSISLRQENQPRNWTKAEVELAEAVASQAAIAVKHSRLYQQTRQQAESLLELNRQKTEFFQNVSHEFRTPLTLTIGPLETAVSQGKGISAEQAKIALRNSRRLLRLVNQMLDLQRLDAGRMQPKFHPCNLVEVIEQIVETFRPHCYKKGLIIKTELQHCPQVYVDLEKFDKVIYNLLSNAMKFTKPGGNIQVSLAPVGNFVQFKVKDTGIGIASSHLSNLFDRFHQVEGSVDRSHEGSGLGLALVKELVELHKGQVKVESVLNQGTTFTVWLQTGTAHLPEKQVSEVPEELQLSRGTVELADLEGKILEVEHYEDKLEDTSQSLIMVVDDNADLRSYVGQILREAGYRVRSAHNGEAGFALVLASHPHLIITDLMMPILSGTEMMRRIRDHEELQGTPIILLTAKADEASRIEGTERGADAYLSKPFNARELLAEVRNLLALKANEAKVKQLNSYLTESVLKRVLPPGMVKKAARGELALDLRPEPRLVTILFSDIVGFTELSNTLRSRRVAQLLNEYLEAMTEAVFANGGTVDKFIGDAIVALFGAPEELTPNEQVRRAIAASRQMHHSLKGLNQKWEEQGFLSKHALPLVKFRCGIHQGTAVVGMFGGGQRADYTAIGPAVNIAARLQEAAEPNKIIVSATVADYLQDDEITKCRPLTLKGIDETVLAFAVDIREWQ